MSTTTVHAEGIVCDGCATAVKTALGKVPGVTKVDVAVPTQQVTVQHGDETSRVQIEESLNRAGFPVRSS